MITHTTKTKSATKPVSSVAGKPKPAKVIKQEIDDAINKGPIQGPNGLKVRVRRVIHRNLRESRPEPGTDTFGPKSRQPGRTFMQALREKLKERVGIDNEGREITRHHVAVEAFAEAMQAGEFPFLKEFIEREEGKVTQPIQMEVQKEYVNLPVGDDPNAP